jgi:hypothetical protein
VLYGFLRAPDPLQTLQHQGIRPIKMVQGGRDGLEERTTILPAIPMSESIGGGYQRVILPSVIAGHESAVFG